MERVDDPARVAAIAAAVAADDVLVADGHHRYAVSRTYRDEVRAATGGDAGPAEETLAFVGELVPEQLSVAAIHRLYADVDPAVLREALARRFDARPRSTRPGRARWRPWPRRASSPSSSPAPPGALTPRPGAFDGVRALDGGWLETALADVAHTVSYQHGLDAVLAAVRGRAGGGRRAHPPGRHRRDRADGPRGPADAAQVDVLHPEAADRLRAATPGELRGLRPAGR